MKKKFLILFGPPGSGKGTQAEKLGDLLKLPVISTGALFRQEIKLKSELGKRVDNITKAGRLVDNDTVNEVVKKRLNDRDIKPGAIFDGYPRNIEQQRFLMSVLQKILTDNDQLYAILVDVEDETVLERLGGRLACTCGATYHIKNKPPKKEGVCDECGGVNLYVRDDDKPEVIKERLRVYHELEQPMLDYFDKSGKLIRIDGEQTIDKVYRELIEELKNKEIF